MKARIVQCLCPQRHALLAIVIDNSEFSDDQLIAAMHVCVDALIAGRGKEIPGMPAERINPWCGMCGAPRLDWTIELQWTKNFETWQDAIDALRDCEARQLVGAAIADMLGVTYDAQRKREMN